MCGRYQRRSDKQRIAEAFALGNIDGLSNSLLTTTSPLRRCSQFIVWDEEFGTRTLQMMMRRGRIALLLLSLASGIGKPTSDGVEMEITNEDVADGANVTPFTVSRSLSNWERTGILKKRRGKILLRKPELLLTAS